MTRNQDVAWDAFDAAAYAEANYGVITADDLWLTRRLCQFYNQIHAPVMRAVDIGTGPNLLPLLVAAPQVETLTAVDINPANLACLAEVIQQSRLPHNWAPVWEEVRAHCLLATQINPMDMLRDVTLQAQSVFTLPAAQWDVATMLFCAESITSDFAEFKTALYAAAQAVRPCGHLFVACMEHSVGYTVGAIHYPAVSVDSAALATYLLPELQWIRLERRTPLVPLRAGYTGVVIAYGQRTS